MRAYRSETTGYTPAAAAMNPAGEAMIAINHGVGTTTQGSFLLRTTVTGEVGLSKALARTSPTVRAIQAADLIRDSGGGFATLGMPVQNSIPDPGRFALVRTDADGEPTSAREYQLPPDFFAKRILTTSSGIAILGSSFAGTAILRLAAGDTLATSHIYTGTTRPQGADFAPTPDGGFVVVGTQSVTSPSFDNDLLVFRTNAAGAIVWSLAIGAPANQEYGSAIVATGDGYLVLGTEQQASLSNGLLIKLNFDGGIVWQKHLLGGPYTSGLKLTLLSDGSVLVGGIATERGVPGGLIANVDSAGTILWQRHFRWIVPVRAFAALDGTITLVGYVPSAFPQFLRFAFLVVARLNSDGSLDVPCSAVLAGTATLASSALLADTPSILSLPLPVTESGATYASGPQDVTMDRYCQYWSRVFGGNGNDAANAILEYHFAGHEIFVAGRTDSFGQGQDGWILALDWSGELHWQRTIGGSGAELITALDHTNSSPTSQLFAYGQSSSTPTGSSDGWIAELDVRTGNLVSSTVLGDAFSNGFAAAERVASGVIHFAAGTTRSGPATFSAADGWIAGFDSASNVVYQQRLDFGTNIQLSAFARGVPTDVVAGSRTTTLLSSDSGVVVAHLRSDNGTVSGFAEYDGPQNEAIVVNSAVISNVVGNRTHAAIAGSIPISPDGVSDGWLMASDDSLNVTWSRRIGGSATDTFQRIIKVGDGYLAIGSTRSAGHGGSDGLVVKLDLAGGIVWQRAFGGPFDDSLVTAIESLDGGFLLAGSTRSWGAGGEDLWVLKVSDTGDLPGCGISQPIALPTVAVAMTRSTPPLTVTPLTYVQATGPTTTTVPLASTYVQCPSGEIGFVAPALAVGEAIGSAVLTVTLTASPGTTVTVNYGTAAGTSSAGLDFTTSAGTLTFPPGATTATLTVPIVQDALVEGSELFTVALSGPANAALGLSATATITILDDELPGRVVALPVVYRSGPAP